MIFFNIGNYSFVVKRREVLIMKKRWEEEKVEEMKVLDWNLSHTSEAQWTMYLGLVSPAWHTISKEQKKVKNQNLVEEKSTGHFNVMLPT